MTEATNGQGRYRFTNLPGGIYQVRFELAGFQTLLRGELQIGAGFAAKVDAVLKLGTLEETVTVSRCQPGRRRDDDERGADADAGAWSTS